MLAEPAYAGRPARPLVGAVPRRRPAAQPHEPQRLHFLRADVQAVMKATKITIDATILFADLRAYTRLSQSLSPAEMGSLLDVFCDEFAGAIWDHDGLLNKTIGDAVMA